MTRTLTSSQRIVLALLWLAILAGGALWLGGRLQLSGDLRKFMPAPGSDGRAAIVEAAPAAGEFSAAVFVVEAAA